MNILEELRVGDRRLLWLINQLEQALLEMAAGRSAHVCLDDLITEMELHTEIEREILIPELRRRCGGAGRRLRDMAQEHEGLEALLLDFDKKFGAPGKHSSRWIALEWIRLTNALRSHILG